jgi:RND family efflux transporter MFP subunit
VLPAQNDQVLVSAKTNGIVIFLDDDIVEGKSVNNGQVLFSISGKGYADNNSSVRYMEAKNNYEKAKSDYDRAKELAKDKIVSERELLDAKNQYDNARVIYENLTENFDETGQRVASSVNGYIKHVYVQNGEHVEPGQPIVSLVKNKKLLLHAEVQQKYAPILSNISSANIRPSYTTETYTLEELNGKILSHGKHTNDDNYLIPVSIQIDNNDRFISGGFVEIYLKTINNTEAITIKNSAIMEEQGNYFVFVQLTPELFEKREIKPGGTDGLKTEIINGITSTERVVTMGAILIKLAQVTGTLDAHSGHVH